ncbi:hypothetical protein [Burkholderia sp. Ac-20365]|uniref:hypothetical protein n=1 Tax=Burkholderia sp. Ac-20365 TaxID=2703897 RepID=UPI00197BDDFC|nr:hypothetical protein [Burkholderia sp. Ac-20365]MBN3759472.1 hypothetical protein [Burkholderia sp. Ac-20365]
MKKLFIFLLTLVVIWSAGVYAGDDSLLPRFSDLPVEIYRGKLKVPAYYAKVNDHWIDDMGKLVSAPVINFAGKYHIGLHSCGADCRYFTLSDLATGFESNELDMFSADSDHPKRTLDGRAYITDLISRNDSKILIAQYHIEATTAHDRECRERLFSWKEREKKLKAITETINHCEIFH